MERFKAWECKLLRSCLGLGRRLTPDDAFRYPKDRVLYDRYGSSRIDVFIVRWALNFLGSSRSLDNNMVDNAVTNIEDIESLHRRRHIPPAALISLMGEGLLVFYHVVF